MLDEQVIEDRTADSARAGVLLDIDGAVATVTLARPEQRNAQTPATWRALAEIGARVLGDDAVRVVVLRAEGQSFSAGLDRAMFGAGVDGEPGLVGLAALTDEALDETIDGFQRAFSWWRDDRVVSVAAVQGHAVGAGFQLALACDLRVMADDVALAMREPSLGLVPDLGGTQPLVEAVGYARALEICATGRWVGRGGGRRDRTGHRRRTPGQHSRRRRRTWSPRCSRHRRAPYARPRRCCGARARGRTTTSARPSGRRRPRAFATSQGSSRWTCR